MPRLDTFDPARSQARAAIALAVGPFAKIDDFPRDGGLEILSHHFLGRSVAEQCAGIEQNHALTKREDRRHVVAHKQHRAALPRDIVVAAHGGGARALMALFNVLPEEEATHTHVVQGVVYVFADGKMARYA